MIFRPRKTHPEEHAIQRQKGCENQLLSRSEARRSLGRASVPPVGYDSRASEGRKNKDDREYSRRMFLGGLGLGALTLINKLYEVDISFTEVELSKANAYVYPVFSANNEVNKGRSQLVTAGFGNVSSIPTALAVPQDAEYQDVCATYLDNKGINKAKLADVTIEYCRQDKLRELTFKGYSQGGLVDVTLARSVLESMSDIDVPLIQLACTPSDVGTLRAATRAQGSAMINLLAAFPDADKSRINRFLVETFGARYREYLDPSMPGGVNLEKLAKVMRYVLGEKIFNEDAAAIPLLASQFQYIVASGARQDIVAINEAAKTRRVQPHVAYIRPFDPELDQVVDTVAASSAFAQYCDEANLTFIDVMSDSIGHADPKEHPEEYAFISKVVHDVENQLRRSANTDTSRERTFSYINKRENGSIQRVFVHVTTARAYAT